jgi:hypothetical protein
MLDLGLETQGEEGRGERGEGRGDIKGQQAETHCGQSIAFSDEWALLNELPWRNRPTAPRPSLLR